MPDEPRQSEPGLVEPDAVESNAVENGERPRTITAAAVLFAVGSVPWLMFAALGTLPSWAAYSAFLLMVVVSAFAYVGMAGIRMWATVLVPLSCVLLAVPLVAMVVVLGQGPPGLAVVMLVPTGIITVLSLACGLVGVRLLYVSASSAYLAAKKAQRSSSNDETDGSVDADRIG